VERAAELEAQLPVRRGQLAVAKSYQQLPVPLQQRDLVQRAGDIWQPGAELFERLAEPGERHVRILHLTQKA
jgi:hypothetical protein